MLEQSDISQPLSHLNLKNKTSRKRRTKENAERKKSTQTCHLSAFSGETQRQFYNVRFLLTQIFTCSTDEVTMAQLVRENTFNDSRPI